MNEKEELEKLEETIFNDPELSWKDRYEMVVSGEYGVFEMWASDGSIEGYRGFRKNHGTTDVYDTYKLAMEAALEEFGGNYE